MSQHPFKGPDRNVPVAEAPEVKPGRGAMTQPLDVVGRSPDELMKLPAAADFLDVSKSTLDRFIKRGLIVPVKFGKRCSRVRFGDVTKLSRTGGNA